MSTARKTNLKFFGRKKNKTAIMVLPLVSEGKEEINYAKVIDVYLCEDKVRSIIVKYKELSLREKTVLRKHANYRSSKTIKGKSYFEFKVPDEYLYSFNMFLSGKYSQIGIEEKVRIKMFHGIKPDHWVNRVLEKCPTLKSRLEKRLGAEIPDSIDLYDKICEEEYIKY